MGTLYLKTLLSKRNQGALFFFVLFFFIVWLNPSPLFTLPRGLLDYLPLHTLMEIFSIIVSVMAFVVTWEDRSEKKIFNTMVVANLLFAVAIVDFAHILSYPEMPPFVTPSGANKSIYFWLCGRFIVAFSMLYLTLSSPRYFEDSRRKYIALFVAAIGVFVIYWIGFLHLNMVPAMFIEGEGLTSFKVYAEAGIVFLLLVSLFMASVKAKKTLSIL